jgi:hypothetical protein
VALENPSFETAGPVAGSAPGWHVRSRASSRLRAAFRTAEAGTGTPGAAIASPNDLSAASWTAEEVNVNADAATAPDGTLTADRLRMSLLPAIPHRVRETTARVLTAGKAYTFGAYLKREGLQIAALRFADGVTAYTVKVGLGPTDDGKLLEYISPPSGKVDSLSAEMVLLENDWCLVSLSFKTNASFSAQFAIAGTPGVTTASETFTGALTGFFVWGAFAFEGELSDAETFELAGYLLAIGEDGVSCLFGPSLVAADDLETWVVPWLPAIPGGVAATFDGVTVDDLEGWSAHQTTITGGVAATFDGLTVDDLETGWSNDTFASAISGGTLATFAGMAGFGGGAFENFESVLDDVEVTPNVDNRLYATAHAIPVDAKVVLYTRGGGTIPVPLMTTVTYFTVSYLVDSFSLALTSGGAAIDITSVAGHIELWVRGSPKQWWYAPDICRTI